MEESGDGGRRRHGVGQPEMEGELRAFRQRTEKDEDEDREIERMFANDIAGGEHDIQIVGADDAADDQQADEEAEPARACHDERHACAIAGRCIVVP